MIQFINSWASGLIVAVIIGTIIEMILPENNNKKYIKIVIGLFILFTIVSPIIAKFGGGIDFDAIEYEKYTNNANVQVASGSIIDDKSILKVYKENLKKEIKTGIENLNYMVTDIKIELNDKDIKSLTLAVEPKTNIENVKKISVDVARKKRENKDGL